MRAMILAAGRGSRMRELTKDLPKPLLKIGDRYLIEYALLSLIKIGIKEVVINVAYQYEQIINALGDGSKYGIHIYYSIEEQALETGGGIYHALPLLGAQPFIVLSCDVLTDYPLQQLPKEPESLAHLVLVDNPSYHPRGDFGLSGNTIVDSGVLFTFSNIGIYRPELFAQCQPGYFRLGDLLKIAIANHQVTGEHYTGFWGNLGTPEDLASFASSSLPY